MSQTNEQFASQQASVAGQQATKHEQGKDRASNNSDERDPAYFHYYGQLTHQQNMLQDIVRTSTYRNAILQNPSLFQNKIVMDIGAGSGILSYFAAQAGAKVIAVEASNMALKLKKLLESANRGEKNVWMKDKIEVIIGKIEEVKIPVPQVDTIISEPIGVMLVHERMIESYIYARDHYLKPGGAMVPSSGGLYLAPFTDSALWSETMMKARFWEQNNFYGVDLSPLHWDAKEESFMMPVVGYFDPNSLIATPNTPYIVDFTTVTMQELFEFEIPFSWTCSYTGIIHGIASWFDIHFNPPPNTPNGVNISMSTGPFTERTHWQQVRFLLKEPLAVNAGQVVMGTMKFKVNEMRSYDLTSVMVLTKPGQASNEGDIVREGEWSLHEQTYNYTYAGPSGGEVYPENNGMYLTERDLQQSSSNTKLEGQLPLNGEFSSNPQSNF